MSRDLLESTLQPVKAGSRPVAPKTPALTILHHADPARVGQVARLTTLLGAKKAVVSRAEPAFTGPGEPGRPLEDPYLSRKGLSLSATGDGSITLDAHGQPLEVDGTALEGRRVCSAAELDRGVVLALGDRVVLLLHRLGLPTAPADPLGMVGASEPLELVRADVLRVADLGVPVLIRGESGSGKELVARALHAHGKRRAGPFVGVNMAAVPATTAAAELFGHTAGAFTGATKARAGHFVDARGGTLFLDEVADMPADVQVMLLRALELNEIVPLGSSRAEKVDARLVSATDAVLEELIEDGKLREALFHRLAGYQITLPPLRTRRDDIGRLLHHFLEEELTALGEQSNLRRRLESDLWLPAGVVARLALHQWPGNVRQLRNVARQLAISSRGLGAARLDGAVAKLLEDIVPAPSGEPPATRAAEREAIDEERLYQVLKRHQWKTSSAATELGVSRTTLYALIERSKRIRKAADLTRDELVAALKAAGGDVDRAAASLEVSSRGIRLRLRDEGL